MLSQSTALTTTTTIPTTATLPPRALQTTTPTTNDTTYHLSGHQAAVNCCKFNTNTGLLATGDADGFVFIWDPSKADPAEMNLSNYQYHKNEILDITWFSDRIVLTASADGTAKLYDIEDNKILRTIRHDIGAINAVKASPKHTTNPHLFITAGDDGMVYVWDARFDEPVHEIATKYPITSVECDTNMNFIYTAGVDDVVYGFDMAKGEVAFRLRKHTNTVLSLALADNTFLTSYGLDGLIVVWDVRPVVPEARLKAGRVVATFERGPTQNQLKQQLHRAFLLTTKTNTPNKKFTGVIAASNDGMAYLYDLQQKDKALQLAKIPLHQGSCNDLDFHNHLLASAGTDGKVVVGKMEFY